MARAASCVNFFGAPTSHLAVAARAATMTTLLIDNYDSYVNILAHLIARVDGAPPVVLRHDAESWATLRECLGEDARASFARVVIGPGPGTPARDGDLGVAADLLRAQGARGGDVPVFGVCLGHQALCAFGGGSVDKNVSGPMHGRVVGVKHDERSVLFDGVPSGGENGLLVTRYHSLATTALDARTHRATAWAEDDGAIMALESVNGVPHFGVQFHPESVCTTFGAQMYANFKKCADAWWASRGGVPAAPEAFISRIPRALGRAGVAKARANGGDSNSDTRASLIVRMIDASTSEVTTEDIFWTCFGSNANSSSSVAEDAWWLDSADESKGRFSYMGHKSGESWRRVTFALDPSPTIESRSNAKVSWRSGGADIVPKSGTITVTDASGTRHSEYLSDGLLPWLDEKLSERTFTREDASALPFDFTGGFVGYLGYEMRNECDSLPPKYDSPLPDAAFFLVDTFVAFDHVTRKVYVVGSSRANAAMSPIQEDVERLANAIETLIDDSARSGNVQSRDATKKSDVDVRGLDAAALLAKTKFSWRRNRDEYVTDIEASQDAIIDGETYEVCLTNMLHRREQPGPFHLGSRARTLYAELRQSNPAPYAALLSFGDDATGEPLVICCCSPERFLRHDPDGVLEAKPIKGTAKRIEPLGCEEDCAAADALKANVKDRAENLMIVDLLRNDLARVCDVGSIEVPGLMKIESYATVHQLVSTVRGKRGEAFSPIDVVKSTFPGGSMTGAPKIRTMEIIDALEIGPRMVYSGSIGFFSHSKAFDLNIVIRSVLMRGDDTWIGAGGAITILSDPQAEWEEIELKACALLRAVARVDGLPP